MIRGATLFSGGGGVEALLKRSITFVHAVEYDPAIAAVYRQNHGDHIQVARVEDVDYSLWGALDYLHASPVCKNASQAKTNGMEGDGDLSSARAVVRCLEATEPRVFTLENVWGYRTFQAFKLICQALDRGGYMWHFEHLNSADFGVPQTRRRLILRAVRDSLLPSWPAPEPWIGWYAAIEDMLDTLPASQFAPWQLERLRGIPESLLIGAQYDRPNTVEGREPQAARAQEPAMPITSSSSHGRWRALIVGNNDPEWGEAYKLADDPMMSITTQTGTRARAFVVAGNGNQLSADDGGSVTDRDAAAPYFTITAAVEKVPGRAFLMRSDNSQQEWGDGVRHAVAPTYTVATDAPPKAWLVGDGDRWRPVVGDLSPSPTVSSANGARAWLAHGRVVKMTPRALARFQSLPDSYVLPDKSSLACTVIGNMVPSLLMLKVVEPLL